MYLLKAHESVEDKRYQDALADFEQAVLLLAKDGARKSFYARAQADKALTQCLLGQYDAALTAIDQALAVPYKPVEYYSHYEYYKSDYDDMLRHRVAILVLVGAYSEALDALHAQLEFNSQDSSLRFTLATCLLHMERYPEAVAAYEHVIAQDGCLEKDAGLIAAHQGRQPDWANL